MSKHITENDEFAARQPLDIPSNVELNRRFKLWTPTSNNAFANTNLVGWYDASDPSTIVYNYSGQDTTGSSAVGQWLDKSGLDNDLLQATSINRPIYTPQLNRESLEFNDPIQSTAHHMRAVSPFGTTLSDYSIFFVANTKTLLNSIQMAIQDVGGVNPWGATSVYVHGPFGGDGRFYFATRGARSPNDPYFPADDILYRARTPGAYATNNETLIAQYETRAEFDEAHIYINGIDASALQSGAIVSKATSYNIQPEAVYQLGWPGAGISDHFAAHELILVNGIVGQQTREKIEGYLAHKWDLVNELPVGHPYAVNPPYEEEFGSQQDTMLFNTWTTVQSVTGANTLIINKNKTILSNEYNGLIFGGNYKLYLGNDVTDIGTAAFANCSGLVGDLVIPDSVTSIGIYAFGNSSFGAVGINERQSELTLSVNCVTISENAFAGTSFKKDLIIPRKVTTIETAAFQFTNFDRIIIQGPEGGGNISIGSIAFRANFGQGTLTEVYLNIPLTSFFSDSFNSQQSFTVYVTEQYFDDYNAAVGQTGVFLGALDVGIALWKTESDRPQLRDGTNHITIKGI